MTTFGLPGHPATPLERDLLAAAPDGQSETIDALLQLSQRQGADAVVAVLDLLSARKLHLPTREEFFAVLFRPHRDHYARQRVEAGDAVHRVACDLGVARSAIKRGLKRTAPGDLSRCSAKTVHRAR